MNNLILLDYRVFEFFNALAGKSPVFDAAVVFFAQYAIWLVYVGLCLWWFLGADRASVRQRLVLVFFSVIFGRLIVVETIRFFYHRVRPFLAYKVTKLIHVVLLIGRDNDASFPSGHTVIMLGVAGSLYFYDKKSAGWLILLGLIIGLARVAAGIHYPSDVLGGIVVGLASAWLAEKFLTSKSDGFSRKLSHLSDQILPFTKR